MPGTKVLKQNKNNTGNNLDNILMQKHYFKGTREEIFTFRGKKLSQMMSYEKFCGNKLSRWTTFKTFHRNKKKRKSKFLRRNIRFYCTVIKVGHLTCVKIAKKEFQKTCFPLFFVSWVLNFLKFYECHNNLAIMVRHNIVYTHSSM